MDPIKPRRSGTVAGEETVAVYRHAENKKVPLFDKISKFVTRALVDRRRF